LALDPHLAAGRLDEVLHHGQADPADAVLFGGEVGLKDALGLLLCHAGAGIDDADFDSIVRERGLSCQNNDFAAVRHRFSCVDDKIQYGVLQIPRIAGDRQIVGTRSYLQPLCGAPHVRRERSKFCEAGGYVRNRSGARPSIGDRPANHGARALERRLRPIDQRLQIGVRLADVA
jgi:hypothetical protein